MELRREDAERVAREGGEPARKLVMLLFDRVAELDKRQAKLERRLGQNSQNSSMPPSKDPPSAPKRAARKRSGRKQGGQPGHEGTSRKLVDDPDETVAHLPQQCRKCGRELTGQDRVRARLPDAGRRLWRDHDWRNWRRRVFDPLAARVGAPGMRPFDLRHAFCSLLIGEDMSVVEVARQAGHAPTMTLDTYAHVMADREGGERVSAEAAVRAAPGG